MSIDENDKRGLSGVEMVRPSTSGYPRDGKGTFGAGDSIRRSVPAVSRVVSTKRRLAVDLITSSLGPKKKDVVTVLAFLSRSFSVHH